MAQNPYENPEVIQNQPRMPLLFLIDTSASMSGEKEIDGKNVVPIHELCVHMNRFKDEVCLDALTKKVLDVAIMRFDSDFSVLQPFMPIEKMMHLDLAAEGEDTVYSSAIDHALTMVDNVRKEYNKRSGCYKPWIVFITDGAPNSNDQKNIDNLAKRIAALTDNGDVRLWCMAVGNGINSVSLHTLSPKRVFRLADYDFRSFINWLAKSMARVSRSAPTDNISVANLEGNMQQEVVLTQNPEHLPPA